MPPGRSLLIALPLLVLAACRGGDSSPQRVTLIDSRDTYDPRSLDPALSTDVPTGRAVAYVFDGLTRFTPDARLEPALAERWEVTPDGRVYTFHLRAGVTFHDGTPFTAEHVRSSFERVLRATGRGGRPWPLYPISGARALADGRASGLSGIQVIDSLTVRMTLDTALSIFPKLLAMPVASMVPANPAENFGERPVGTGPWRFVEWRRDDYLLFARNDAWWDGAPRADSLLARVIPEPSTAVAEFEIGRVDLLSVPEAETRQWQQTDDRKATLHTAPGLRLWYVAINVERGPLRDPRVRQALNHAVDSRAIVDRLIGGRGTLAGGVVPPPLGGPTNRRYEHDPARARQLLAAAGYPNGIDIDLWHSTDAVFSRVAQTIQSYLAQANIRARLVQREAAAARQASRAGESDMILKDWFADYPDAENFLFPLLHSANRGAGGNVSFYANPAYDRIVDESRREVNDERRADLYRQADSVAFAEAPMIFLFFFDELFAVQPWIRGFEVPVIFNGQRWTTVEIAR